VDIHSLGSAKPNKPKPRHDTDHHGVVIFKSEAGTSIERPWRKEHPPYALGLSYIFKALWSFLQTAPQLL